VLVSSDGESDRVLQHHLNVAGAVTASRVGHVVLLSSLDSDVDSPFCYGRVNGLTEQAMAGAAGAVTPVRASIYAEFFATLMNGATVDGQLRLPAEDALVSLVARDDVAACLAACALQGSSAAYDVTGPAALSMAEIAEARGARYVPVSEAEFAAAVAHRETPWWAYAYTSMFASIREHRWEVVSDAVPVLTGRTAATAQLG
jgi:NAD(P)H dehydrogenase (quinone)